MSRTTRNRFTQPFLVGAMSSAFFGGCITIAEPVGEDGTPERSSTCPTDKPLPGSSCEGFKQDLVCATGAKCGGSHLYCDKSGVWAQASSSCNPPPPAISECPEVLPADGSSCAGYAVNLSCARTPTSSCPLPEQQDSYTCDASGYWQLKPPTVTCNPPPPPQLDECPDELPTIGTPCPNYASGLSCAGPERECNGELIKFHCDESGVWRGGRNVACNPPPPMGGAGGEAPL